jgi:hypothetical protein
MRRLGPDAADDIVAETFLLAFRRRESHDLARDDARSEGLEPPSLQIRRECRALATCVYVS